MFHMFFLRKRIRDTHEKHFMWILIFFTIDETKPFTFYIFIKQRFLKNIMGWKYNIWKPNIWKCIDPLGLLRQQLKRRLVCLSLYILFLQPTLIFFIDKRRHTVKIQTDFSTQPPCVHMLSTCRGLDQWWGDHGDHDGQAATLPGAGHCGGGLCDSVPWGWHILGTVGLIRRPSATTLFWWWDFWQQVF